MGKTVLAIPFRDTDGTRTVQFEKTKEQMLQKWCWDAIIAVDSGHTSFNRAATRNLAFIWVEENFSEDTVLVCCDADSVCEDEPLRDAILSAEQDNFLHYPFDLVFELIPKATAQIGKQGRDVLKGRAYGKCQSEGGIWVTTPKTWWKAGGQDPRFTGWGCEDRAMVAAGRTLLGEPVRHPGYLFCMYHNRDVNNGLAWLEDDVNLLVRYHEAFLEPNKMMSIINERIDLYGDLAGNLEGNPTISQIKDE